MTMADRIVMTHHRVERNGAPFAFYDTRASLDRATRRRVAA